MGCQRRGDVAEGGSARAGGGDSASGIMTTAYRGGWGWTARAFAGSSAAHLRRSGAGSARCGCGPFRRPCLRGGRRGAGRQGEGSGARRARDRAGDGASTNTPAGPRRRPYATTTGSIDERAPARRRGEGTHRRSEASARSTRGVRGSRPRRGVGARGGERARSWTPSARSPGRETAQTASQHPPRRESRAKSTGRDSSARGGSFSSHTRGSSVFSSPQRAARHRWAISPRPVGSPPPGGRVGRSDTALARLARLGRPLPPGARWRTSARRNPRPPRRRGASTSACASTSPRWSTRFACPRTCVRARDDRDVSALPKSSVAARASSPPSARVPPPSLHRRPSSPETTPSLPPPPRSPRLVPPRPRSAR